MDSLKKFTNVARYIATKDGHIKADRDAISVTNGQEWLFTEYKTTDAGLCPFRLADALSVLRPSGLATGQEKCPVDPISLEYNVVLSDGIVNSMLIASAYVSHDETRYFLSGIHFEDEKIIASNGCCMYVANGIKLNVDNFNLPVSTTLKTILKHATDIEICDDCGKMDKVFALHCYYQGIGLWYCCRKVDGQFPAWRRVVPATYRYCISAPDVKLWSKIYTAVKKMQGQVRVGIALYDSQIDILSYLGIGGGEELVGSMDVVFNGEHPEAGRLYINGKFLDRALTTPSLGDIRFSGTLQAVRFDYSDGAFALIMPMKEP